MTFPPIASAPTSNRPARYAFGLAFVVMILPLGSYFASLLTLAPDTSSLTPLFVLAGAGLVALVVSVVAIVLAVVALRKKDAPRTLAIWALVLNTVFSPVWVIGAMIFPS